MSHIHEIFVVKLFSSSLISAKIKYTKIEHINTNAVWGNLPKNNLTQKLITQNNCKLRCILPFPCLQLADNPLLISVPLSPSLSMLTGFTVLV